MNANANRKGKEMKTKIVQRDNGYFEDVEVSCCGQTRRVWTEYIQWGITPALRKENRDRLLAKHVCNDEGKW